MYAELVEGGSTPERRAEMNTIVTDELIPALEAEPGYARAINLANPTNGEGAMIVQWQTQEQSDRPLAPYGGAFPKALARIARILTATPRTVSVSTVAA